MSEPVDVPITFDTLAVRSLNTCRVVHLPTYAGLRLLLASAANDQGYAEIEAGVAISATAWWGKAANRRVVAARLESSSRRNR